jgi:hypothetical protein
VCAANYSPGELAKFCGSDYHRRRRRRRIGWTRSKRRGKFDTQTCAMTGCGAAGMECERQSFCQINTHTHARRQILGLRETWSRGRTFHFNSGCQNRPHVATHKMGNRFSSPSHFRLQLSFSGVVAKKTNNCKSRVYKTELIQESGKT